MLNERDKETFLDRMNLARNLAAHAFKFEQEVFSRKNRITITLTFEGDDKAIDSAYTAHLEQIRQENIARENFYACAAACDKKKCECRDAPAAE